MVYTTGGMSIARVSVVDGSGKEIFDELVRLDDNVELMYVQSIHRLRPC
jgi:RNA exonuclease 1